MLTLVSCPLALTLVDTDEVNYIVGDKYILSTKNRDVPPDTCARNRHKCIEYVPKRVLYHCIITCISLERVYEQRCLPSDQCDVSESSFIHK